MSKRCSSEVPDLAIIGGSGLCNYPEIEEVSRVKFKTKYGFPSDDIIIGKLQGKVVAFLPRHGSEHTLLPHEVPYMANMTCLKEIGVKRIISTCIVGSLKKCISPGSIVIPDQFVDLTCGRVECVKKKNGFTHLPMANPYCEELRQILCESVVKHKLPNQLEGTVVVIQGPRFATIAESRWFCRNGWDIINMTQYPECYFARELGICYASMAAVTDYDVGISNNLNMTSKHFNAIFEIFQANIKKQKKVIHTVVEQLSSSNSKHCRCAHLIKKPYYESNLTNTGK